MDRYEIVITAEGFAVFDLESLRILASFDALQGAWDFIQAREREAA